MAALGPLWPLLPPTLLCVTLVDLPLWHTLYLGNSFSSSSAKVISSLACRKCRRKRFIQFISKSLCQSVMKPPAIRIPMEAFQFLLLELGIFLFFYFFNFLYSRFLLVIPFIHISVYMSIPVSQFIPPPPPPPPAAYPLGVHTFVLFICVSISVLQTGSSVPFF